MFEGRETLWVVHIGKDDKIPLRARDEGFICIGWTRMGDLTQYSTRPAMKEAMGKTWPNWKQGKVNSSYGQVFRFAHKMQIGDPVVFPIRQTREVAIGKITGPYEFRQPGDELHELDYGNARKVEWLKIVPRTVFSKDALHSFGSFSSVSTSNDHLEEVIAVLNEIQAEPIQPDSRPELDAVIAGDEEEDAPGLYEDAVQQTEDYLLKSWHRSGADFEHVVAAVLEAIGYTASVTRASGDHGVDVIAHPDPLGLEPPFIKVQVKSGTSTVGEPEINQLIGAVDQNERGLFVSLGGFSKFAEARARNAPQLSLIDAEKFVQLFLDHYEGLDPVWRSRFPLKRVYVPQS